MSFASIPPPIVAFLRAAREHDLRSLLGSFTSDAVLTDEGREYRGDAITDWTQRVLFREGVTVHPINVARRDHKIILTVMVSSKFNEAGATRPFQADWWFTISGDRLSAVTIVREKAPDLPAPLATYVQATNTFDLEAMLTTFADDALVNDQLREYRGKAAIRGWAAREIIGDCVTMYVVNVVEHDGQVIVTANVDGDYDKRGLPDPLVLAFYFSIHREKVVQLIILRNEPAV
jgi:SnoaL-like domain